MDEGSSGKIGEEFVPEKDPEFIRDRLKVVWFVVLMLVIMHKKLMLVA